MRIDAAIASASTVSPSRTQAGRDDGDVAQRQRAVGRDEDRAAAHLGRVLRGTDDGGADALRRRFQPHTPLGDALADFGGEQAAEIAEALGLPAIDVFRDPAGERHLPDGAAPGKGIEAQEAGGAELGRAALHGLEQAVGHAGGEPLRVTRRERRADLELEPEVRAEPAAGFLQPGDPPGRVGADEARADVDRGDRDHLALGAHRDLGGAAADVDVHHGGAVADRARDRAGAEGRHHRFEIVAGADRDQLAGLAREQFADLSRIAAADRDAGEDQRAGVDLVGIDHGVFVLLLEERAQRVGVDLILGRIGREQNVGLIEGLALGDDIAAVEPFQHDARKHEMRCRRADVDPDAQDADLVLSLQAASGGGKENPPAGFVDLDIHSISNPHLRCAARPLPPSRRRASHGSSG